MATIKIDRGFTQKIQAKGLVHTPISVPPPPPPKKKGWQPWMTVAVIVGVVALVAVIGAAVSSGGKKKPAAAAPVPRPAAAPAAQPVRTADTGAVVPVEPEETRNLYEKPATVQAAEAPKPPSPPPKPILREIALGAPNGVLCEYYENIPDGQIKSLRAAPSFPGQPTRTVQVGRFELSENVGDLYGVRARAFVTPPKSGAYRFSVCGDDAVELWLSADDTPDNARKIVSFGRWVRGWGSRSDQQSEPCELEAGKRYYIEALMKEGTGGDFLTVGWSGPVSEKTVVIGEEYLRPWSDKPAQAAVPAASAAEERRKAKAAREAALAPAREAVAEQQRAHADAYRFAEAAQELKKRQASWSDPAAAELAETAVLRFELLARLRAYVQEDLSKARVKGVWVAFGGQADVTGASDEGVTVAPGRIVAWAKIPKEQMMRLVNAVLARTAADPKTKGSLYLGAALFCRSINGKVEMVLKFREAAVSHNASLASLADRLLDGNPEALQARPHLQAARLELERVAATAALREKIGQRSAAAEALFGEPVKGLLVEYWEDAAYKSLEDVRNQGLTTKRPPDSSLWIFESVLPESHGEKYVARVKGYLTPKETGEFLFYIAADDQGEFWLSPDEDPNKAKLCVKIDSPGGRKQWDKDKRKSEPVALEKGRRYFLKMLLREGERGDHLSVAWSPASANEPAVLPSEVLAAEPSAGVPPVAADLRKKIEDDLRRAQALAAEVDALCEAEEARAEAQPAPTKQSVTEAQGALKRAQEALAEAERALERIDAALPPYKAALGGKF